MRQEPIIELDVHGLTVDQAISKIEDQIRRANASTYRIRVIHGFNRGNNIQRGIYPLRGLRASLGRREIGHGLNPKVLRITGGDNPGITELILREF